MPSALMKSRLVDWLLITAAKMVLLIGRIDHKDASGQRILWSLPKGHIEEGETPEQAAFAKLLKKLALNLLLKDPLE
jgi:ADP-ribose pyrophosphatase YjhB (NUDIX family)